MSSLGILSDTHALLRPAVATALERVDLILHAGDIGSEQVVVQLGQIAPVIAVRGNVDTGAWAQALPLTASLRLGGVNIFVIHNRADLRFHPAPAGTDVIVYGHSHKPARTEEGAVCYLNPGSAGPRRFSLPISFVLAYQQAGRWAFHFQSLTGKQSDGEKS